MSDACIFGGMCFRSQCCVHRDDEPPSDDSVKRAAVPDDHRKEVAQIEAAEEEK